MLDDQNKWAGLVGILPDITINTPPADWIKGYLEYEKLIPKKKQARSTKKDVKDEQPAPQAPQAPQPAPQPVLPQIQPIIIHQPAPAPAPQPQYAPPRVYRDEYPRGRPRFQQRRPAPPQPASSPIRRPVTDLLPEFLEWLLAGKEGEEQRIKDAFEVIIQQGFQLDDLKADAATTILNQNGVPGSIALHIQRNVSPFSRNWKAHQEAAQGLQNMAQQAQAPEYPECPRPVPRGHTTYISSYIPDYSEGDYEFYSPGGAGSGDYYKGNW
jgi:hypothetical protein